MNLRTHRALFRELWNLTLLNATVDPRDLSAVRAEHVAIEDVSFAGHECWNALRDHADA